jgi:sulfur carrier protein ThiS
MLRQIRVDANERTAVDTEEHGSVTVETYPARAGHPVVTVPLRAGMTLQDLMEILKLPGDTEAVIVNNGYVKPNYRLQDGDRVRVIPFMSGG